MHLLYCTGGSTTSTMYSTMVQLWFTYYATKIVSYSVTQCNNGGFFACMIFGSVCSTFAVAHKKIAANPECVICIL